MSNFTAADVKKLRDLTGSGMMDCKKALEEAGGDFDKAVEILRIKGAKDVGKRAGRTAANGLVAWLMYANLPEKTVEQTIEDQVNNPDRTQTVLTHFKELRDRYPESFAKYYGEPTVEVILNEQELLTLLGGQGLTVRHVLDSIPYDLEPVLGEPSFCKTYVCESAAG